MPLNNHVCGVTRCALRRDRVRHISKAHLCGVDHAAVKATCAAIGEPQHHLTTRPTRTDDPARDTVPHGPKVIVADWRPDDHVVAGMQVVGPARHGDAVVSEFAVLVADRLGASVKRIELLVR